MKKSNLSFVLALLALQTGGCIIYQGEQKEDNLCYKIVDGVLQSFYPPKPTEGGKERPVSAPSSNPASPSWGQILENNWTVEVIQTPESLANALIEGLKLEDIQADNETAVKTFEEKFNAALSGITPAEESAPSAPEAPKEKAPKAPTT